MRDDSPVADRSFLRPVVFIVGILNAILGAFMVVPAITDVIYGNRDWAVFALSALTIFFVGAAMSLASRQEHIVLTARQGFLLTALAWTTLPLSGAVPFL